MRSVLLQLHCGRPLRCDSWSNAPVAHGVQVTVYVEHAGGGPETLARRTHAALEREFARLGALRGPGPCSPGIYGADTCAGAVAGLVGRVLIYIADGTGMMHRTMEGYFSHAGTVVIPIVDKSLASAVQNVLPQFMRTKLAESTTAFDPGPVLPRLIRAAGIVTSSVRLFVSYRHSEAATVAGQLFHTLAERGFEPFLDRFCSGPGDDFVDLIREELADKACLVSLETAGIRHSLYCRQEVATAVSRRMGLIAVDLPGSMQIFKVIQKRVDASKAELGIAGELSNQDVRNIVDEIERHYPHEAVRRPRWQDNTLNHAIAGAGLRASPQGLGCYVVHGRTGDQLVVMSAGLPQADHFIDIEEQRKQLKSAGSAVFGPLSAARGNRYREVSWLASKSGVAAQDEGRLLRYVNRLR
jgi:hypothetical protein